MSDHNHNGGGGFGNGLFLGILLGVGIAMFLKTKEGQRIKKQLFFTGEEMLDDVSERVIEFLEDRELDGR